jgi:Transposase DDE domain
LLFNPRSKNLRDLPQRLAVINLILFIKLFGKGQISYVVADREFDGYEWLSYLKDEGISYVQRLKDNIICMGNRNGKVVRAKKLCRGLNLKISDL